MSNVNTKSLSYFSADFPTSELDMDLSEELLSYDTLPELMENLFDFDESDDLEVYCFDLLSFSSFYLYSDLTNQRTPNPTQYRSPVFCIVTLAILTDLCYSTAASMVFH